jgi:hypothetical protein
MKQTIIIFLSIIILSATTYAQQDTTKNIQSAVTEAETWLALIDAGEYGKTWDTAAKHLQNAIAKTPWEKTLAKILAPFGKIKKRELTLSKYRNSLPGVIDGDYVVLKYKTKFEKKAHATETVTLMKEKDNKWYVAGYFIK